MKNWGVKHPVCKWQTSGTDKKHKGNPQSERISSEENRNSSFPTATTMGKNFQIYWASKAGVELLKQPQLPRGNSHLQKKEEELVPRCGRRNALLLPGKWTSSLATQKERSWLPKQITNGYALQTLTFQGFCWLFVRLYIVWGLPCWLKVVKNPPAMRETWVRSLGWDDLLEKGMATHSRILAWRIPWTEEPGGGYSSQGCKESDMTERLNNNNKRN